MKEVYLYFRTQATIGDDDAAGDSAMYPLSSLTGMVPSADDTLNLYFKKMIGVQQNTDDDVAEVLNNDKVVVTLSSVNTHKDVIARLSRLFAGARNGGMVHHDGFIDVVDDKAGTTAVTGIAGLSTITTETLA